MDYKKKYKQLHTLISDLYPFMSEYCKEKVEGFFPELAGSKDERIRKALLEMVHDTTGDELWVDYNVHKEEALSWLEKQGNQKSKQVSIWKHWKDGIAGNGEGEPIYLVKNGNTYSLNSCLGYECDYIELSELDNLMLEKQGNSPQSKTYTFEGKSVLEAINKISEEKPAWSKEDDVRLQACIDALQAESLMGKVDTVMTRWLKSLKQRIEGKL